MSAGSDTRVPRGRLTQRERRRWLASAAGYWLPLAAFVPITVPLVVLLLQGWLAGTDWPGNDAALCRSASAAWLAGENPWAVGDEFSSFAGSPLTVLVFVPSTLIPEAAFRILAVAVSWVAAAWLVRRCALPWYWLAFPPLVTAAMLANPGLLATALALTKLAAISPMIKSFMGLPVAGERRWRALAVTLGVTIATVVLASGLWAIYLPQVVFIGQRLLDDVHYSGTLFRAPPVLLLGIAGLAALLLVDARAAAWLTIPAIWPALEYHYGILIMPVAPILAIPMALDSAPLATATIGIYGLARLVDAWRRGGPLPRWGGLGRDVRRRPTERRRAGDQAGSAPGSGPGGATSAATRSASARTRNRVEASHAAT